MTNTVNINTNDPRPWRPCVGIMLINEHGMVCVGQRIDSKEDHWQMPQGGIDEGEKPEQAAKRELHEELGTTHAHIIAKATNWYYYDIPYQFSKKLWQGRYRGQKQMWFLFQFTGTQQDINIQTEQPEFRSWKWMPAAQLLDNVIPFKHHVYEQVLDEFSSIIQSINGE